jgi:hypothetical protein
VAQLDWNSFSPSSTLSSVLALVWASVAAIAADAPA